MINAPSTNSRRWRSSVNLPEPTSAAAAFDACDKGLPSMLPPAASMAARAPAVTAMPLSTIFLSISPFFTILAYLAVVGTSLAARSASESMVSTSTSASL